MKVLVATASRHGPTAEIGHAIPEPLRSAGHEVAETTCGNPVDPAGCDVAVIGSAVYAGHWLKPAKTLITHGDTLRTRPVWLFSLDHGAEDSSP